MTIDASIPLQVQQFDLGDILRQKDERQVRHMQMEQLRRGQEQEQRLSQFLPGAMKGDQAARDGLLTAGPKGLDAYMKMDDRTREEQKKHVEDFSAAVRWADTPEKWEQAKQHYRQQGMNVPDLPFQNREQVVMELGQMKAYLDSAPKPSIHATQPGGGLYSIDPSGAMQTLVMPNDGSQQMGAPVQQPQPQQGGFSGTYQGIPGETVTSGYRTPEHNREVGGVPNSYHTRRDDQGNPLARDSVPPRGMTLGEYGRELQARNPGARAITESDHVHLQPRSGGGPRRVGSKADYDQLPSGAVYIAPDGSRRKKP